MADFGDTGSWDLGYNLFYDKWLGTNFINSSVCPLSILSRPVPGARAEC